MLKQSILWSLFTGVAVLVAGCGSDGAGGSAAAIRQCQDQLAGCDSSTDDCEEDAVSCIEGVRGDDVTESDIADDCEDLYVMCTEKSLDDDFCEDLDRACLGRARGDDDDDERGRDDDFDDDGYDDDGRDDDLDDDGNDDDDDNDDDNDGDDD